MSYFFIIRSIDFETAIGNRSSIYEVGICAVCNGKIIETRKCGKK